MIFTRSHISSVCICTAFLLSSGVMIYASPHSGQSETAAERPVIEENDASPSDSAAVRKVLFLGDSMTGWMSERFDAYGDKNGFEVATVVWDGSTIKKWGSSPKLRNLIDEINPDAILVCLGMNELYVQNPATRLKASVESIKEAFNGKPFLWIGPPSWPGNQDGEMFSDWLASEVGERNFFRSAGLNITRQSKSNPHPDRKGIELWIDSVAKWIPSNSDLKFKSLDAPPKGELKRGKTFIYKKMNEKL